MLGAGVYARGATPLWALTAAVGGPVVVVAAYRFVASVTGAAVSWSAAQAVHYRPSSVDLMSGTQFEDYVADAIRSCGLPVIMTSATGDWGVDLIVGHRPERVAVQCKRYSKPIGPAAVQEVVAGAPMQGCTRTMVVSNQEFTPAAHQLAAIHDCVLVPGSELVLLGRRIRRVAGLSGTA